MSKYKHTFKSKYRCWQIPIKVNGERKCIEFGTVMGGFYYGTNDDAIAAAIQQYIDWEKQNGMINGWKVVEKQVTRTVEVPADQVDLVEEVSKKPIHVCDICNREFDSPQGLASHKRLKHPTAASVNK